MAHLNDYNKKKKNKKDKKVKPKKRPNKNKKNKNKKYRKNKKKQGPAHLDLNPPHFSCVVLFPFLSLLPIDQKPCFSPRKGHFMFVFACLPFLSLSLFWPPPFFSLSLSLFLSFYLSFFLLVFLFCFI